MPPNQTDSELVVQLAKTFMAMMQDRFPGWSRAFFRFSADEQQYGSKGSFERDGQVMLLSTLALPSFFENMTAFAHELWKDGPQFRVMLLTVHADFDYQVQFEPVDGMRWAISKLAGASGLPIGVT